MKKRGFTLIELVVSVALSTLVLLAIWESSAGMIQSTFVAARRLEGSSEVNRLAVRLIRETRLAQACQRQAAPVALVCRVDMNSPPTLQIADDADNSYAFDPANNRVVLSRRLPGRPWAVLEEFSSIGAFAVCGDAEMAGGTCPLNDALSARHVANRNAATNPTPPNRFFRIQIRSSSVNPVEPFRQIAIFVRHPLPVPGYSFEFASRD